MLWTDVVKVSYTHPKKCLGKGLKMRGMGWSSLDRGENSVGREE